MASHWMGSTPPFRSRVLIAAPHPDDEVLGCGGVMVWLAAHGFAIEILAVTDGAASHSRSRLITRDCLVERRIAERAAALGALGLGNVPVHRLGFSDAETANEERELSEALASHLDAATTLLVPWSHDGHPDHEAVARAGATASHATGAGRLEVPIWARVRGRRCTPSYVLELGSFRRRKRLAVEQHRSQIVALGPSVVDGPVVHPDELDALTSATEWLVKPPKGTALVAVRGSLSRDLRRGG
jgi:LmbE family N-acetylglucosaminyl deacetylase